MKSFKEYILEKKNNKSFLSWDSDFSSIRSKIKLNESSSFHEKYPVISSDKKNEHDCKYNSEFFDHPDIIQKSILPEHKRAITSYCSAKSTSNNGFASSSNMNAMLRNMSGDKTQHIQYQDPDDVKISIKTLSSVFKDKNNTNRKQIQTFAGIPHHIGEQLMNSGKDTEHHLAAFTSTSIQPRVAHNFAMGYNKKYHHDGLPHIIKFDVKPGAGLPAAHHSPYDENEVILHHGAKITYHGHEILEHTDPYSGEKSSVIVHHVTVHPEHKSLEEYGSYDHPKE